MSEEITKEELFESYDFDGEEKEGYYKREVRLDENVLAVFVAIEGEAKVAIGDQYLNGHKDDDQTIARDDGTQHLYLKLNPAKNSGGQATLRVQAEIGIGKRLRVLIIILRRGLNWLKCPACKKLVRMLLMLLLTGGTAPHLIWPGIKISSLHLPNIAEIFKNVCSGDFSGLPSALVHLFKDAPWLVDVIRVMRDLLGFLDDVFDLVDKFLEAVCRKLGMC